MARKKDKSIAIRIPDSLKRQIQDEAEKNIRTFQDETVILLAEAIHARKFNIKNYL